MAGHILIVDDDVIFRTLGQNYSSRRASMCSMRLRMACRRLRLWPGDARTGYSLTSACRGRTDSRWHHPLAAACPDAKIVLISAGIDYVPAEVLETCGANAFLPKQELAVADLSALLAA